MGSGPLPPTAASGQRPSDDEVADRDGTSTSSRPRRGCDGDNKVNTERCRTSCMSDNIAGDSGTRDDSSPEPDAAGAEGTADDRPVVYDLAPDCTLEDVETGARYHAVVNGVVEYGVFVDVSDGVSGLVHESNLDGQYTVGDRLIVRLTDVRENGDVAFDEAHPEAYRTETVAHDGDSSPAIR
jgi:RecJ-like exonuclease